ncbi:MAG: DUF4242 domain-containing protein [Alphaproteobacteria bacterium]|nr:DUF4242 domain-containing protein [Alphaproteobacteria bacterium]
MSLVIVERSFPAPITGDDLLAQDRRLGWCFSAYNVRPLLHCLAKDGMRVLCALDAPDAEAVRQAGGKAGMKMPDRLWAGELFGPAGSIAEAIALLVAAARDGTLAVVERSFATPVLFNDVQAIEDAASWCFSLHRVAFLASFFARDRRRMACLYAAPDADAVRQANSKGAMPFDRVWSAQPHSLLVRA